MFDQKNTFDKPLTLIRAFLPFSWASTICWLSLIPNPPSVLGIFSWDKALHAGAYLLLTILAAQFFLIFFKNINQSGFLAIIIAVLLGAVLEILQGLIDTGRTPELFDLLANLIGAIFGYLVFRYAALFFLRTG